MHLLLGSVQSNACSCFHFWIKTSKLNITGSVNTRSYHRSASHWNALCFRLIELWQCLRSCEQLLCVCCVQRTLQRIDFNSFTTVLIETNEMSVSSIRS